MKLNPLKDQARKPPGILGRMPVKKVIRTSLSKDREYIDERENSSDSSLDDGFKKMAKNAVKPTVF